MPIKITMPRMSDTMEEGTLIKWRVSTGDEVSAGDILADVETDKATMELQSFDDGTVAKLAVDEGDTTPVGSLIAVLAGDGESVEDAAAAAGNDDGGGDNGKKDEEGEEEEDAKDQSKEDKGKKDKGKSKAKKEDRSKDESDDDASGEGKRIRVSPVARNIAEEHDLDLKKIKGTGPDGRIIKRDVLAVVEGEGDESQAGAEQAAKPSAAAPVEAAQLEDKRISLSNMRKTIAKRLVESKSTIPHFTVTVSIDTAPLMALRKTVNDQLEEEGVKLSLNDYIVRATTIALTKHPLINASWADDAIHQHGTVNIGVAIALPAEKGGGLVVATLRDVQTMSLRSISSETRRLAKKAREQGLTIDEMSDSTLTISNLGMFGVDHFEAIINPPNAAILAIGAALEKPVVRDGELTVGQEMTITMSCDHRVIDGAMAAEYLQTLKGLIEAPAAMLV